MNIFLAEVLLAAREAVAGGLSITSKLIIAVALLTMIGLVGWMVAYRRPGPGPDLNERPKD